MLLRTMVGCRTSRPRRFVQDEQVAENRMLVEAVEVPLSKRRTVMSRRICRVFPLSLIWTKDLAHDAAARLGRHVVAGE